MSQSNAKTVTAALHSAHRTPRQLRLIVAVAILGFAALAGALYAGKIQTWAIPIIVLAFLLNTAIVTRGAEKKIPEAALPLNKS
jgi:Na+/alanine symporter